MEKRLTNPWPWHAKVGYSQAVEVSHATRTLYCAGQAALDADGQPSTGDMPAQVRQVISNLEQVLAQAGYQCRDLVRLTVYTTSTAEFMACFDVYTDWIARQEIQLAATLVEVKLLAYDSLRVEFEATAAR